MFALIDRASGIRIYQRLSMSLARAERFVYTARVNAPENTLRGVVEHVRER